MFLIKKCLFGGVLPERLELTMRVLEPKEARPRGIWGRAEGQDRATARTIADPSEAHADSWLFCARYDEPQRVSDIQLTLSVGEQRSSVDQSQRPVPIRPIECGCATPANCVVLESAQREQRARRLSRPYSVLPNSPESQAVVLSVFMGSGRSQSKLCNVHRPLPPGGSARIK